MGEIRWGRVEQEARVTKGPVSNCISERGLNLEDVCTHIVTGRFLP